MKRTATIILTAMLVLLCFGGTALAASVEFKGDCHVRSYPSVNAPSLGIVREGAYLDYLYEDTVDDRGTIWYKVDYNNRVCWVSSKYTFLWGGFEYIYGDVYVNGDTYICQGPDQGSAKLGTVHQGDTYDFLGDVSEDSDGIKWYRIVFGVASGWISSRYSTLNEYF